MEQPNAQDRLQQAVIEPKSFNPKALNTIFIFIVPFIVSLLQLKSQGDDAMVPFSTNPYTILLSAVWLLLYCWAYAACSKPLTSSLSSSPPTIPTKHYQQLMIIFGALTLTSLGSLLFPSSAQHYTLYTMYAIIGLGMVFHWAMLCQKISQAPRGNLLPLHTREIAQPQVVPRGESIQAILYCQRLLRESGWQIKVAHVYREGNRAADWLVNRGVTLDFQLKIITVVPLELSRILEEDVRGVALPRLVPP